MELTHYLDALRDDLLAAAALGDEDTRRAATLLTTALEPAARLMLMSALSDFAAEITELLHDTTVDVSLRGRELRVTVSETDADADTPGTDWSHAGEASSDAADDAGLGQAVREAGDELSRTTLRIVNRLKAEAEHAAINQGVSLNTYIQRAVSDAVRAAGRRSRRSTPED
ncbi:MAG: toxin-antitoxin system HicB family antitoxin [Nakamurella sp.]